MLKITNIKNLINLRRVSFIIIKKIDSYLKYVIKQIINFLINSQKIFILKHIWFKMYRK